MSDDRKTFRIGDCTEIGKALHNNVIFKFGDHEHHTVIYSSDAVSGSRHTVIASDKDMIRLMQLLAERYPLEALACIR